MAKENDPKGTATLPEEVKREIDSIGSNVKETIDNLQRDWKQFQDLQKEAMAQEVKGHVDPLVKEQIDKITEAITQRQEKLDEKFSDRVDKIETAMNRSPMALDPDSVKADVDAARNFKRDRFAPRGRAGGFDPDAEISKDDIDELNSYRKSFVRYLRKDEHTMEPAERKDLSVGSDPDGGYVVTPQMSDRVIRKIFQVSPIRALATVETISTDSLDFLVDKDEVAAGWVAETGSRSKTDAAQFAKKNIPVHEIYAQPGATQKLLDDAAINIENWLADKIGSKFARTEASAFVSGDGVGKPRGFLTYPAGTDWGQIEQVNTGANGDFTSGGIIDAVYSLKEEYVPGARFIFRRQTVAAIMKLQDTAGNPIWSPSLIPGQPSTLLGHPVSFATDMPALTTGALCGVFGDLGAGYTIVDRVGMRTIRDNLTNKPYILFYTTKRVGGDVVNFEAFKILKAAT